MVGHGVLRACLLDPRHSCPGGGPQSARRHPPKLQEIVHHDFTDLSALTEQLTGLDACFYCLGISSAGRSEAAYTRITHTSPSPRPLPCPRTTPD